MRSTGQVVVLAGILLVGASITSASAGTGFGQQWRPADGYLVTQPASSAPYTTSTARTHVPATVQRIANVPSFRPRSVRLANRFAELRGAPRADGYQQLAAHSTGIQQYQRYTPYQPYSMPTPMPASQGFAAPVWAGPFGQMAQAFPNPMPMFNRTFAWRQPADQWSGYPPAAPSYGQHAFPQYPVSAYRDFGPASAAVYRASFPGNWRPLAQARLNPVQHRSAADLAATSRGYAHTYQDRIVAAGNWRPLETGSQASLSRHAANFRPQGYGRSTWTDRTASTDPAPSLLPGWATTFNDSDAACSWCSGS
ncbi:MAG: hypothetical protein KDI82_01695 [Gammaproteobacteria bacterium]|nr:hypothetical protein [Gammaproteobacteria bacterium]